jgi:homoserine dehydrogenase
MLYRIGIAGCGTVGRGFLEILDRKAAALETETGFQARIVAITDTLKGSVISPQGLDIKKTLKALGQGLPLSSVDPEAALPGGPSAAEVIAACPADIILELTPTDIRTGEPAAEHIRAALRTGKHVVTTNKGPVALHLRELRELASRKKRLFRFEGAVMSGTPVFSLVEHGFAGNTIREISGILNGTTNFILSKMETEDMEYGEALAQAQKLGYAEADPTADVEGLDALAKIVILANVLLGADLKPSDIRPEGISGITRDMVRAAKAEGLRYKLVGYARRTGNGAAAGVGPRQLPSTDPLAGVMGARNALTFDLDLLGPVTIEGPGAGRVETGQAVLQDLLAIHRELK